MSADVLKKMNMKMYIYKGISALAATMILSAAATYAQEATTSEDRKCSENAESVQRRWGIIDFSASYLRQLPDYESPLETQELMGTVVEITGEQGYWLQVRSPQPYTAWCTNKGVHEVDEAGVEEWISAKRYIVTSAHSAVYAKRSKKSEVVCDLLEGDIIGAVLGKPKPKVHLQGLAIRKCGWAKVETPDGRQGWTRIADIREFRRWATESNTNEKSVVETALRFVGTPYLWGGMSPNGFDCSGLVRFAYLMNGTLLPRNANQMAFCGRPVPVFENQASLNPNTPVKEESEAGNLAEERRFCADSLKAGDMLFFGKRGEDGQGDRITHVGLYIGDGRMIHASHLVRVNSLVPGEADYYENAHRLLSAVRIIGHEDETRDERFKVCRILDSASYFR